MYQVFRIPIDLYTVLYREPQDILKGLSINKMYVNFSSLDLELHSGSCLGVLDLPIIFKSSKVSLTKKNDNSYVVTIDGYIT